MAHVTSDNVSEFQSFLAGHLTDKNILDTCLVDPSLATLLFVDTKKGVPNCSDLSDALDSKWLDRIPKAYGKKFSGLDVEKMQKSLRLFIAQSVSLRKHNSDDQVIRKDPLKKINRKLDRLSNKLEDQSAQLVSQTSKQTNLSHSMIRLTNCVTSSLVAGLESPGIRGLWLPQPITNRALLNKSNLFENNQEPSQINEDVDGRLQSDEDMWFVFENEILDAGKKEKKLLPLFKQVFGPIDSKEIKLLDDSEPKKKAINQLTSLVSKARLTHKTTLEAAQISSQRKASSLGAFDEDDFIDSQMASQFTTNERATKHQTNRVFQNARYREKKKLETQESGTLYKEALEELERLKEELSEQYELNNQLNQEAIEKDKLIEELKAEVESFREHDYDDEELMEKRVQY